MNFISVKLLCYNIMLQVLFYLIQLYSQCQIYFIKCKKYFDLILKPLQQFKLFQKHNILIMDLNGNINLYNFNKLNFEKDLSNISFCVYTNLNHNIILKSGDNYQKIDDYEISNFKFVLIELIINDKIYKIDLKTNEYNYYIVNNIIDINFLIFFLNYHLKVDGLIGRYSFNKSVPGKKKIILKIIDQNINTHNFEISHSKFILIKKDTYLYQEPKETTIKYTNNYFKKVVQKQYKINLKDEIYK